MDIVVLVLINLICYNIWFFFKVRRLFNHATACFEAIQSYLEIDLQGEIDDRFEEIVEDFDDD